MLFRSDKWHRHPSYAYGLPNKLMRVPAGALRQTLRIFEEYRPRSVETVCFWYGDRDSAWNGTVRAVVVPRQQNRFANYDVDADAIEAVASATRTRGWVNLCQIHTHPDAHVEHSAYDNEHAVSRKVLSIVFPYYGLWRQQWPKRVGVHEFQDGQWHLLRDDHARERVQVVNDVESELLDLRKST